MFWGLIMEPHRRYTQIVKRPFHISMASLDISASSEEPAQVMCGFEGRNYLICTLRKPDMLQCALDLNFEAGDELSLATNGKCHIHLTGYLIDNVSDSVDEEEDEEEEDEVESQGEKKNKRNKSGIKNGRPSKKLKSEEQDESSDDDDSDDGDVDVNALFNNTLDSDEDDETFNEEEEGEEAEEEEEVDNDSDEEGSILSESDSEAEITQPQQSKVNKAKVNGSPKQKQEAQKDKKNKKNQQQQIPVEKNASPKKESPKKVLQNGLIIEDLKEGQGQPVKSGKFVTVYYEGRLKSNNKLFDSTKQGKGFSFRLGGGEVIKGWDQGLVGMKIGGKRKITCPPNMGYGAKGSPPTIPGNSTLVFEVELKKVR